jgi:hypothetical protein
VFDDNDVLTLNYADRVNSSLHYMTQNLSRVGKPAHFIVAREISKKY